MYWCYQRKRSVRHNQVVQAELVTPVRKKVGKGECGFGFASPRQDQPYGVELKLIYRVNPKHSHPDNYAESHAFDLYSARLVELMQSFGVKFEAFPVTMVDPKGNVLPELRYFVFHSLEGRIDAMDHEQSEWPGDIRIGIPRLALDYSKFEHRPLFTCAYVEVPLMRDDLKQEINRLNISGFGFLAPEKYCSGREGGYKLRITPPYDE